MKPKNYRKVLLIDPPFQKSFIAYTVGSAVGVSAFYFIAIRIFFWRFKAKGIGFGLSPDHVFFRFLDDQRHNLELVFLGATFLMLVGLIYYGLYLSNRIAGPIYHLKKYLREYREGKITIPLKFRKNDYFMAMADELNLTLSLKSDKNNDEL